MVRLIALPPVARMNGWLARNHHEPTPANHAMRAMFIYVASVAAGLSTREMT